MSLVTATFYSPALQRTVPVQIVLPTDKCLPGSTGYEKVSALKTVYLLHGIYGSMQDWNNGTRVRELSDAAGLCVVMPSGDNKFYADSPISGDYYGDFITRDLVSYVENSFPVSRRREDRILAGLSMGGYGAIVNALRHPELFGSAAGFSSALIKDRIVKATPSGENDFFNDRQYCTMFGLEHPADFAGSVNDYDWLAEKVARETPGLKPKLYLSCGTEDGLMPQNRQFRAHLENLGYDLTWEEWPGDHTWKFWDESIEKLIAWLRLKPAQQGISSGYVTKV